MQETWKQIDGYEDYEISNLWNVVSTKFSKRKELKKLPYWKGYLWVELYKNWKSKRFYIHRLVYWTFSESVLQYAWNIVMHKDNNPENNNIDNLKLWTQKQNIEQRELENRWNRKVLTIIQVKLIRLMLDMGKITREIAEHFKVSQSAISHIKKWRTWHNI